MIPARWPREDALQERLLHVDPRTGALRDARIGDLAAILRPGDLLVVNEAATMPGSLTAGTKSESCARGAAPILKTVGITSE